MAVGFVLITTEPGREIEVRDKVAKLDNVSGQWIVLECMIYLSKSKQMMIMTLLAVL